MSLWYVHRRQVIPTRPACIQRIHWAVVQLLRGGRMEPRCRTGERPAPARAPALGNTPAKSLPQTAPPAFVSTSSYLKRQTVIASTLALKGTYQMVHFFSNRTDDRFSPYLEHSQHTTSQHVNLSEIIISVKFRCKLNISSWYGDQCGVLKAPIYIYQSLILKNMNSALSA